MNPCRLHALFDSWFQPKLKATNRNSLQRSPYCGNIGANGKPTRFVDFDDPHTDGGNLLDHFMK